jgi:hypothetical protein
MGKRDAGWVVGRVGLTLTFALTLAGSKARADYSTGWMIRTTPGDSMHLGVSTHGPTGNSVQTDWGVNPNSPPGTPPVNLFVDQFNPNDPKLHNFGLPQGQAAQLVEVDLRLDYAFTNTLTAQYVTMATITVSANGQVHVSVPGNAANSSLSGSFSNNPGGRASTPADVMPGAPPVLLSNVGKSGQSGPNAYTDAGTLNTFTGTSQVALPAYSFATSSFVSTSGNGKGFSLTTSFAAVYVQYIFKGIVPEPSSVLLTALGLAGLAAWAGRARWRSWSAPLPG